MPHAGGGGGGGGGGFHSSSGSSGSTVRYDSYGHEHSTYYVRPGFYYNKYYVPYEPKKRIRNVILMPIIVFTIFFIVMFGVIYSEFHNGGYSESKLNGYAMDAYYKVYDEDSSTFESNILVTIVTYENGNDFDYISMVGDNVVMTVDIMFGNQNTVFGGSIYQKLSHNYTNMYEELAKALDKTVTFVEDKYCNNNHENYKIINESPYNDFGDENVLILAEQNFFNKTGYHVSFYISYEEDVYKPNFAVVIAMGVVLILLVACLVPGIVKGLKATKEIDKASKEGRAADYFEGEVTFEEFQKENPYSEYNKIMEEFKEDSENTDSE